MIIFDAIFKQQSLGKVAVLFEHRVQIIQAAQVVPELGRTDLDDERGRIESLGRGTR